MKLNQLDHHTTSVGVGKTALLAVFVIFYCQKFYNQEQTGHRSFLCYHRISTSSSPGSLISHKKLLQSQKAALNFAYNKSPVHQRSLKMQHYYFHAFFGQAILTQLQIKWSLIFFKWISIVDSHLCHFPVQNAENYLATAVKMSTSTSLTQVYFYMR